VSAPAEGRYRQLLRLYPKAYREARGAEMLATYLDAAESGRSLPARREVAALIVGALRARAGIGAARTAGQIWLSALRLAALLLVAHAAAQSAARAGRVVFSELLMGREPAFAALGHPAALAIGVLALVAVAGGRYGLGIVLTVAMFVLGQWAMNWLPLQIRLVDGEFWPLPVAMLLMLPLLRHRPAAAARPPAWLLAIPAALILLPTAFDDTLQLQPFGLLAVCLGCLAWSVVDVRAAVAGSALLLGPILSLLGFYLSGWANGRSETALQLVTYAVAAAVLIGVAAPLIRRRAKL
jgi:hypothetical protein